MVERHKGLKSINKHVYTWVGSFLFGALGVDRFEKLVLEYQNFNNDLTSYQYRLRNS